MPPQLQEGRDYYLDRGLFVLTEHYLRERGFCCENGCRHCPYGFRKGGPSPAEEAGPPEPPE